MLVLCEDPLGCLGGGGGRREEGEEGKVLAHVLDKGEGLGGVGGLLGEDVIAGGGGVSFEECKSWW